MSGHLSEPRHGSQRPCRSRGNGSSSHCVEGPEESKLPADPGGEVTGIEATAHTASYPHTAIARVGPPDAPTTLGAPTNTVAPAGGNFDRLATHSRPHLPAPSQSLWTAKSFDAPKSSDSVSTANPATSRSLSRNSHASFEKPGKCSVIERSWPRNALASPAFASQPEFRNTPQFFGSRPCAFSHALMSSTVTTASAFLRARSRISITAAATTSDDASIRSAVIPSGAK